MKGERRPSGPEGVWRSVFSACFRAVEADWLDDTLRRFHVASGGGRPVLPLYDGLTVAAPLGVSEGVGPALVEAAAGAASGLGLTSARFQVNAAWSANQTTG